MSNTQILSNRTKNLNALKSDQVWDVVVLGSGSAALGIALDAAARGFSTVLLEERDFNTGPSFSGRTLLEPPIKDILQPSRFSEVRRDFQERRLLEGNAPAAVSRVKVVYPVYTRFLREALYALKTVWRFLGDNSSPRWMDAADVLRALPGVRPRGLQGGVEISALKINPFRLGAALLQTAQAQGAVPLNHMTVTGAVRGAAGEISALEAEDQITHERFTVKCRMIFNATEERTDEVRSRLSAHAAPITRIVSETRISVADDLMEGGKSAVFLDKTEGSKSVFCTVPGDGMVRIGVERSEDEEGAGEEALLEKAQHFMLFAPTAAQIRARSLCRRALFKPLGVAKTKKSGMLFEFRNVISVVSSDWLSYRRTAEEALAEAAEQGLVYKRPCPTAFMSLRGGREAQLADEIVRGVLRGGAAPEKLDAFVRSCAEKECAAAAEDVVRGRLGLFELDEAKAEALVRELQSHELFDK